MAESISMNLDELLELAASFTPTAAEVAASRDNGPMNDYLSVDSAAVRKAGVVVANTAHPGKVVAQILKK